MNPEILTSPARPEFFRLPSRGQDPIFGLSRSFYYGLEKAGKLHFKRLRKAGGIRGVVLVPVAAVAALIERESVEALPREPKAS